jgi:hypothetical protein
MFASPIAIGAVFSIGLSLVLIILYRFLFCAYSLLKPVLI